LVCESDKVFFVDEIDSSLHPLVVHQLVRLLHRSDSKAQLVFTTHDTTILSQDIMRRDQVWFIEKDKSNASKLYPLSDFKVRQKESLESGYLHGRYGAIPFIKEFLDP
jgi:AAA15 family ATPase/GTPase